MFTPVKAPLLKKVYRSNEEIWSDKQKDKNKWNACTCRGPTTGQRSLSRRPSVQNLQILLVVRHLFIKANFYANFIGGEKPFYINRNYGNGQIGEHFRDCDGDDDCDDCNDGHVTDAVELRSLRKPQIVPAVWGDGGAWVGSTHRRHNNSHWQFCGLKMDSANLFAFWMFDQNSLSDLLPQPVTTQSVKRSGRSSWGLPMHTWSDKH